MPKEYRNLVIIGNGFDRWLGLPTSYEEFRKYYNAHIDRILKKFRIRHIKIKDKDGKKKNINPVELIYSNPLSPESLKDDFFWTFEQSIAALDDQLLNLYFGKSNRGLRKLRKTVAQAQRILRSVFSEWIASIEIDSDKTNLHFSDDCYFINFNYTDTLQKMFGVSEDSVLHIHGMSDDPDSIVVGHASHPEYPFKELWKQKLIRPKSQRLKGLYLVESALYETDKHIQDNIDDLCEFMILDGVDIEKIENIYVLGHSFGEPDLEYFDFLVKVTKTGCNYNDLSALWKVHHMGFDELTEDKIFEDMKLNVLYAQHHGERELRRYDDLFPEYTVLENLLGLKGETEYTEEVAEKANLAVNRRFIFEQAARTKEVLNELCLLMHYEEEVPASAECASVFKLAEYIQGTHEKRKDNAKWHISYFSDNDKKRIKSVMASTDCTDYELVSSIDKCVAGILE